MPNIEAGWFTHPMLHESHYLIPGGTAFCGDIQVEGIRPADVRAVEATILPRPACQRCLAHAQTGFAPGPFMSGAAGRYLAIKVLAS